MRRNRHHLFYPKKDYRTGVAKKFRQLPCNIITVDYEIHQLLHFYQEPPEKPTVEEMQMAIQRHAEKLCGCYY